MRLEMKWMRAIRALLNVERGLSYLEAWDEQTDSSFVYIVVSVISHII